MNLFLSFSNRDATGMATRMLAYLADHAVRRREWVLCLRLAEPFANSTGAVHRSAISAKCLNAYPASFVNSSTNLLVNNIESAIARSELVLVLWCRGYFLPPDSMSYNYEFGFTGRTLTKNEMHYRSSDYVRWEIENWRAGARGDPVNTGSFFNRMWTTSLHSVFGTGRSRQSTESTDRGLGAGSPLSGPHPGSSSPVRNELGAVINKQCAPGAIEDHDTNFAEDQSPFSLPFSGAVWREWDVIVNRRSDFALSSNVSISPTVYPPGNGPENDLITLRESKSCMLKGYRRLAVRSAQKKSLGKLRTGKKIIGENVSRRLLVQRRKLVKPKAYEIADLSWTLDLPITTLKSRLRAIFGSPVQTRRSKAGPSANETPEWVKRVLEDPID